MTTNTTQLKTIDGYCYDRHEDNTLWLAVSYQDNGETKSSTLPVDEETGYIDFSTGGFEPIF